MAVWNGQRMIQNKDAGLSVLALEIGWSYDFLISMIGVDILVEQNIYTESGPGFLFLYFQSLCYWNIWWELGKYHGCWWLHSLQIQVIGHDIDYLKRGCFYHLPWAWIWTTCTVHVLRKYWKCKYIFLYFLKLIQSVNGWQPTLNLSRNHTKWKTYTEVSSNNLLC